MNRDDEYDYLFKGIKSLKCLFDNLTVIFFLKLF